MALTDTDKAFITLAIKNGMNEAVGKHAENCSVKNDYYGNGKPGTKMDVHDLKQQVAALKRCKAGTLGFFKAVSTSIISSVLTAAILVWFGLKVIEKPQPAPPPTPVNHGTAP